MTERKMVRRVLAGDRKAADAFFRAYPAWPDGPNNESAAVVLPAGTLGAFGAAAHYQSLGSIEERDASGNLTGKLALTTIEGSVAFARPLWGGVSAGVDAGFLSRNGASLSGKEAPLGAGVRWTGGPLAIGLSGMDLASAQPTAQVSASYAFGLGAFDALVSGGGISRLNEERFGAGAEIQFGRQFGARVGYLVPFKKTDVATFANLTAGVGFTYRSFGIDYAFLPLGDLGQVHKVQVTFRMTGAHEPAPVAASPAPASVQTAPLSTSAPPGQASAPAAAPRKVEMEFVVPARK